MSFEVLIVGGGFTGISVAAALAARGAKVCVFETAQRTDSRFRGELIHPRGVRGLEQLGLKAPLFAVGGVAVNGFAVSPGPSQPVTVLPYASGQGPDLGIDQPAMVLSRVLLLRRSVGPLLSPVRMYARMPAENCLMVRASFTKGLSLLREAQLHQHHDRGLMQLIETNAHKYAGHTSGFSW